MNLRNKSKTKSRRKNTSESKSKSRNTSESESKSKNMDNEIVIIQTMAHTRIDAINHHPCSVDTCNDMLKVNIKSEQQDHFDVGKKTTESKDDLTTELHSNDLRRSKVKDFAARKNHGLNQTIKDKSQAGDCRTDQIGTGTLVESNESGIQVILETCEGSKGIDDLLEDITLQDCINEPCLAMDTIDNDAKPDAPTSSKCLGSPQLSFNSNGIHRKSFLGILNHSLRKSKSFDETQSDKRHSPLVNGFTAFIARNTTDTCTSSSTYHHLDSNKTSKIADEKQDSRRQRFRRQASEPKKTSIHPEKRHSHKRQTSDPITPILKEKGEPAPYQNKQSTNNPTHHNSLGIPRQRRAWASTPTRSTDQSPSLLLRRKFANSRATSMPESSRHPLAFENTSFDETEGHIPVEPLVHPVVNVDDVFARCNVQDWSLEDLLIEEKKIRLREFSWILNDHNQVFGAEEIIHLPRKLSIVDRNTFEKVRYVRRNAIHIYDRNEFKQILKRHIIRKHAFSYEY